MLVASTNLTGVSQSYYNPLPKASQEFSAAKTEETPKQSVKPQPRAKVENPFHDEQVDKLADKISQTQFYTKEASKVIAENLLRSSRVEVVA